MKQIIFTLVIAFFITGCVLKEMDNNSYKFTYLHSTGVTNFSALTKNLLKDLSPTILDIKRYKKLIKPLYITDFVNLNNLDNKSQLGFLLSDELKTNVTQDYNWPIYQVEFTKYLKIGENGTKLLSRDIDDIKNKKLNRDTYALIGTYSITQRQLLIYLKLINLQSGVILRASTKRVTLTDEILKLEHKSKVQISSSIYQPLVI
jgi:TolB-like protein